MNVKQVSVGGTTIKLGGGMLLFFEDGSLFVRNLDLSADNRLESLRLNVVTVFEREHGSCGVCAKFQPFHDVFELVRFSLKTSQSAMTGIVDVISRILLR